MMSGLGPIFVAGRVTRSRGDGAEDGGGMVPMTAKVGARVSRYVDFSAIPEPQLAMHSRLENWGRACFGGATDNTAPMFRMYQPQKRLESAYGAATKEPIDRSDAHKIGVGVYGLPDPHRQALHWYYVRRGPVIAGCRAVACTAAQLARYVCDGRTMLINRQV